MEHIPQMLPMPSTQTDKTITIDFHDTWDALVKKTIMHSENALELDTTPTQKDQQDLNGTA